MTIEPACHCGQLSSAKTGARPEDSDILTIAFDDNRALSLLCGGHDENLALIEHRWRWKSPRAATASPCEACRPIAMRRATC